MRRVITLKLRRNLSKQESEKKIRYNLIKITIKNINDISTEHIENT